MAPFVLLQCAGHGPSRVVHDSFPNKPVFKTSGGRVETPTTTLTECVHTTRHTTLLIPFHTSGPGFPVPRPEPARPCCRTRSPGAEVLFSGTSLSFCWLSNVSHELSRRAVRIVYDRYWAVWTSVSTWTPLAHSLIDRTGALPVSAHWDASGVLMFVELSQKRTR